MTMDIDVLELGNELWSLFLQNPNRLLIIT
jgi:hypothetical protein